MNMKRTTTIAFGIAIFLLGIGVIGCESPESNAALNKLLAKLSGPSASQLVDMAFDPDDADRRRQGVVGLSEQEWAHDKPSIMKGIALILDTDPEESVRCVAARALGKAGDPNYVAALTTALRDISPMVRCDAATALDNVIDPSAEAPLCDRADRDDSADVRIACARALRNYRTKECVKSLVNSMDDENLGVRYMAHSSLVEIFARDMGPESHHWQGVIDKEIPLKIAPKAKKSWWKFARGASEHSAPVETTEHPSEKM